LLVVPSVAATVAPVPFAGASPAWSPGVTDVATGTRQRGRRSADRAGQPLDRRSDRARFK